MPIRITEFGGIVPRLNAERLPDTCAQEAFNCDVTTGALRALRVSGEFVSMHDTDGFLKPGIPDADVVAIPKPTPPSVNRLSYLAEPTKWLTVHATDWVSYTDNAGNRIVTKARAQNLRIVWTGYSEADLYLVVFLPLRVYVFNHGGPYFLRGPNYQFVFRSATNGPDQSIAFPVVTSEGDPEFTPMRVPLVDENTQIYGYFEVADVNGPRYDEDILVTDFPYVTWVVPGSYVLFRVAMNYTEPRRRHLYYVSAAVDVFEREGPPSEISEKIVLKPGQKLTLNTPIPRGYRRLKLYRAGTTRAKDFALIDDNVVTRAYTDWKEGGTDELPPFGNFPGGDKAAFLRGSVMHPSHFGAALYNGNLYLSDQYRPHAWPEEYVLPFPGAFAIAGTGNAILVFGRPDVHAVVGGNPANMAKQLLSTNHPLLNVQGLCRLGDIIYWPTHDGLAASNGGRVELVTTEHFRREQWAALKPGKMIARTADSSIFLEHRDDPLKRPYLRFDFLAEKLSAVTTYSTLTNGSYRWHSKRFFYEQPTIIDFVRVVADGPVTLNVYADRELVQTVLIDTDDPVALASFNRVSSTRRPGPIAGGPVSPGGSPVVRHAREWSFEVSGDAVARRIEAFERVIHDVTDEIRLTSENTPVWRSTWARFTDIERWAVMQVNAQTTLPVTVRLYADGVLVHTTASRNGRAFALPRTLPKANLWTIDVESPVRIDSLYATRRRMVDAGDGIREINDGPYAPWLARRYKFTDERRVTSVIVHAAKRVRMNLYYDGAIAPSETVTISDDAETPVTLGQYSSVEFDFNGEDSAVREVIVFVARVQPVGHEGISLVNPASTRGLLFKFADQAQLACGSIGATDYKTLRVTLKADGITVWNNQRVTNGRAFALPHNLPAASLWEVDITGGGEIHSVVFLPRMPEVLQTRAIFVNHPRTIPPWLYKRYTFALGATRLISAWAELGSEASVRIRLYLDGSLAPAKTLTLNNRVETLLDIPGDCTTVDFDFVGDDSKVVEMGVFGREVQAGDMSGISTGPRQNWRRLAWRYPDRADMAVAVVASREYGSVRLRLLADGRQVYNATVHNARVVKLPRTPQDASLWEADLEAPRIGLLENLILVPRRSVPSGGTLQRTRTGGIPPWLFERYEFPDRQRIRSVIVDADAYPVRMRLYYDKSSAPSETLTISDARERLVASPRAHGCLEFDFVDDGHVRDVTIFPMTEELVGPDGVVLQNPPSWRGLAYKFADKGAFAAASVGASAYPVTLTLNGTAITVTDGGMVLLPRTLERASRWSVDVDTGAGILHSLVLVPARRVDAGAAIRETRPEIGLPPWLFSIYQFTDTAWPGAAIVHADAYPVTMRIFRDGDLESPEEITIESADEQRIALSSPGTINDLRFDFSGNDTLVREVILFTKAVQDASPLVQIAGPSFRRNLLRFAEPSSFASGFVTVSDESGLAGGTKPIAHLHLYADGVKAHTERITSPGVFTLPADMAPARIWEVDVQTSSNVTGVMLVPWQRVVADGTVLRGLNATGTIPAWTYTEYQVSTSFKPKSGLVQADVDIPLDLYVDGAHRRYMLTANRETRFGEGAPEGRSVRFRLGGKERLVSAVAIFPEQVVPIDNRGIVLRGAQGTASWRNYVLVFKDTGSWRVGRVVATQYPVTVRLYAGNDVLDEIEVMDGRPFKFDAGLPNRKQWGLDVELRGETAGDVYELVLIARDAIQLTNGVVRITKADDPFSWVGQRVMAAQPVNFSACRVHASAYPVRIRVYDAARMGINPVEDDRAQPVVEVLAHDDRPFRLPRARPERLFEIDVEELEGCAVYDVAIGTSMDAVRI